MNTENKTELSAEQALLEPATSLETKYKRVVAKADGAEEEGTLPVDYRRVQHGHGPCSCCGPYSE
ncbi:hypothetical protein [Herminiimonas arsenitoxidans]|uniref:hypothetical protein n=1 Tax=Herminiimonas arsenitoxidans TaxID=1809410 RepID=UPI0009707E8D|nr:hypothetical protein [Herminiimonas arsenitoxidans]